MFNYASVVTMVRQKRDITLTSFQKAKELSMENILPQSEREVDLRAHKPQET